VKEGSERRSEVKEGRKEGGKEGRKWRKKEVHRCTHIRMRERER
jgi:hypothetical protein